MPLLDHFRPPIYRLLGWESFHSNWATRIADALNDLLPGDFLAIENSHVGAQLEIDVATLEETSPLAPAGAGGATQADVLPTVWSPPQATGSFEAVFPATFEVQVYWDVGGRKLVGAIELISPSNKDRPAERKAFASKCAAYIHAGISVIIIDVVTERGGNLHNETLRLMDGPDELLLATDAELYSAAYRPVRREQQDKVDVWTAVCEIGATLPTMPLRLRGDLFVPVDFESTYMEACRRRRLA